MTWIGSILGSLLALVALSGAAEGQLGNSPAKVSEVGPLPDPEAPQAPALAPPLLAGQELISVDVKDVDLVDLLLGLAAQHGKNFVIGDDVKGKISVTLRNVPWETALETILESRGLQKIEKDNVIRIVSNEQRLREREAAARLEEATAKAEADMRQKMADAKKAELALAAAEQAQQEALARGPLREATIRLSYSDPVEVAKTLQGILGIPPQGIQAWRLMPLRGGIAPGPGAGTSDTLYYCADAKAYYPNVQQGPGGWLWVVPTPPQ